MAQGASTNRRNLPRWAALVASASLVLVLGSLGPATAVPELAAPFANGTASATAILTRFTPGVGSLPTGLFGGVALTNVTNTIAQAQAETLDFGLIGSLLIALDLVPSESLPGPIRVDNRHGDASATDDEYPIAGTDLGGGRKSVKATTVPSAVATSTLVSGFGDVVKLEGGRSESISEVLPGKAREARSSVSVDLDLGGIVQLSGLRWDAVHHTGDERHVDGTFGLKSVVVGGVPLPLDSLAAVETAINTALAPSGISVQLPKVEQFTTPVDVVRVTSLRVMLKDTPAGKTALGPILNLSREQREQLYDDLSAAYGPAGATLLAADVAASIVSGSGFLSIEVGGAEASSGPLVLKDPFGQIGAPSPGTTLGPIPLTALPPLPVTGTVGQSRQVLSAPVARGVLEDACESIHLLHPNGCSGGRLLPVGLAGLVAAVAVGALDLGHQRRLRLALVGPAGETVLAPATGTRRAVRSYAPLLGASLAVIVLATSVGMPRDRLAYRGPVVVPEVRTPSLDTSGAPVAGPLDPTAAGASPVAVAGPNGAGAVGGCADRTIQVPGDPYSPPCYSFAGDNGGVTSRGVTKDSITVTVRSVEAGSATDIFASLAGQSLEDSAESAENTIVALAEYFSDRFQMYGRRLKIEYFRGQGNGINELLGGGKESALADAVKAAKELGAFADVSGITIPYADSLARNGVVNFGSPYPSQRWYEERRPYAWSLFSDGTNLVSATSSAVIGRFPPGSRAEHAGAALKDRPRRFAVIAPENSEYQESMNVLIDLLRKDGIEVATNQKYKLDLASFPNQASGIIAQIKDAGVTSVICICDPAMLAFGLTPKANEQDYEPEWITAGIVFVDQDVVAQTIDTRQWSHAFGTAYNAVSEPIGGSFPYFAYKSVRPDDEPALGMEELYYQMYLLVIGVQMAGPDLTPESFEAGMFAYPDAFGPRGTWNFGPGDYTPTNDYREIWWDPKRISAQDRRPGAWAQLDNGKRYTPQRPPKGRAPYFEEG